MKFMQNPFVVRLWHKLRTTTGIRFSRFAGASIVALLASTTALSVCDGLLLLSSTLSAVISWLFGAAVSYILSRWAWGRKGRPNMLRETLPFLGISVVVVLVLSLATKLGYGAAADLHLHGARHVAVVELVFVTANFGTFLMRFVIFHCVLFKDRPSCARADVSTKIARHGSTRFLAATLISYSRRLSEMLTGRTNISGECQMPGSENSFESGLVTNPTKDVWREQHSSTGD